MTTKYFYKLQTPHAEYYVVIKRWPGSDTIYLGGESFYCLTISGPTQELIINKDPQCYMKANFPQNRHKANDMIYALLFLMKKVYNSCQISLLDTSENPSVGSLTSYYIAFHGSTWYEKDFDAFLEDTYLMKQYTEQKNIFHTVINKEKDLENLHDLLTYKKVPNDAAVKILDLMEKANTISDFLDNIKSITKRNTKQNDTDTLQLKKWLHTYITIRLGFHFITGQKWIISCNTKALHDYKCTITQLNTDPWQQVQLRNDYVSIAKSKDYKRQKKRDEEHMIQIGSGKKVLSKLQRKQYKNCNWIGWKNIKLDDYNIIDQIYLQKCIDKFN